MAKVSRLALVAVALAWTGCTTVSVTKRDGCWVKRTRHLGNVQEELGPCVKPPPKWADDRITRIVQECVTQADHRWESEAMVAWSKGQASPARQAPEAVLHTCLDESARTALSENEQLKARLAQVTGDRDRLAAVTDEQRKHLVESHDRLAVDLGEAARKVQTPATVTATATSEGRSEAPPAPVTVVTGGAPVSPAALSCGPAADGTSGAPASAAAPAPRTAKVQGRHPARGVAPAAPSCPPVAAKADAPAPAPAQVVKEAAAPSAPPRPR